jgi:hypothetical protein
MPAKDYSDKQLKERLVDAYVRDDDSPEINQLRGELYRRGYRRTDIIELAIVSLIRRDRLQRTTFSLN